MGSDAPLILGGRPAQELISKILVESHKGSKPLELCGHEIVEFPDTEIKPRILDNVRGRHVVVVQSACAFQGRSVDTALRELYLLNDALGRASAGAVTVLLPYFPYARQDRKDEGRTSVSVSAVVRELEASLESVPIKRVLTIDVHNPALEGCFRRLPLNLLTAMTDMIPRLLAQGFTTLFSPDTGGASRTEEVVAIMEDYQEQYPNLLRGKEIKMAVAYKRRHSAESIDIPWVVGADVIRGANVAIIDDMISTGGTAAKVARILRSKLGASRLALCTPHAVCANQAWERLGPDVFDLVLIGDTLPVERRLPMPLPPNWQVISMAPLLVSAIQQINTHGSLTSLWQRRPEVL